MLAFNAHTAFTSAFAAALLLATGLRLWLASRQMRHVVQHRSAVPAAYAQTINLTAHQKAADYTVAGTRLGVFELLLDAALLVGWTLLGGLHALNQALLAALGAGMAQQMALLVAFSLIGTLIGLPFSAYQTFRHEQKFGFNKTTPRLWWADLGKSLALSAALGLPLAWVVLWLMGAAGGLWWLWAWGAVAAFMLVMMWLGPTLIMPLFNTFEPLNDEALKARVSALMQRCGYSAKGFFVMDGSRRSAHSNAFFTGFGSSKRVVFFDTLLAQLSAGEMEAVLAHELGHQHHKHIPKRLVMMLLSTLAFFALLGWLMNQMWFYTGLGVQPTLAAPNHALALLLLSLALPVFTFLFTPVSSHFSRKDEFEADAFAARHAQATDLEAALLKLYRDNASTLTPDPWYVRWYYSHPPATQRLARLGAAQGI